MKEVERFCDFRWENENMNKVEVLFSVLFLLTKMKVERFFFCSQRSITLEWLVLKRYYKLPICMEYLH